MASSVQAAPAPTLQSSAQVAPRQIPGAMHADEPSLSSSQEPSATESRQSSSQQSSHQQQQSQPLQCANSFSSFSSSPRQFPTDLPESILEEEAGESGSESPIEPVTPVSGRHSQDFATLNHDHDDHQSQHPHHHIDTSQTSHTPHPQPPATPSKAPLITSQAPTPSPPASSDRTSTTTDSYINTNKSSLTTVSTNTTISNNLEPSTSATPTNSKAELASTPQRSTEPETPTLSRRSTRGSTSSFKRTMSNIFRRSSSNLEKDFGIDTSSSTPRPKSQQQPQSNGKPPTLSTNQSSTTTRSNSPPSPGSPLEMAATHRSTVPEPADFSRKNRASTGFTLRGRAVNFVGGAVGRGGGRTRPPRRASSFDAGNRAMSPRPPQNQGEEQMYPPERLPWPLPPDAGTGAKARRMSLSLPDDFTVDVGELHDEYEYQSKILGRHGKHLGKGAASKVTMMVRKGFPSELYAVKEFRGKSNRETEEDYGKKIKSEYSIAKSLHHPNIVETIRLCTDHGRWNHVMEYCSEGDLFSLVQKGHLKGEDRKKDRLCLFKQLVQGVNYLHSNGIAHRDIKLENLLITKDSKLKITDFGVSEVFSGTHPGLREAGGQCGQNMGETRLCSPGICGSEPYIAPEVLEKKEMYDPRALDVWSSAIVMIYMTFGGAIWSRAERGNLHYDKLADGWEKWKRKHECDACITETDYPCCLALDVGVNPPALRRLMLQMLNPDPKQRIAIADVLNNRWMKNVECCQLESYDDPALTIDARKKDGVKNSTKKIFCHNHLPVKSNGHSLGKMPGQSGY